MFDQFARDNNQITNLGIKITDITLPPVLGKTEKTQNYDQSFSQEIVYGNVVKNITTLDKDIFSGLKHPLTLHSNGLVQTIQTGNRYTTLAKFENEKSAVVKTEQGKGSLYYLAAPLKTGDYHLLLSPIVQKLKIERPILALDQDGNLITGAEVRSVEREDDYLVYASNLTSANVSFYLEGETTIASVQDLRTLEEISGNLITLLPFQETIFRIKK